jgi:hypothetical protein
MQTTHLTTRALHGILTLIKLIPNARDYIVLNDMEKKIMNGEQIRFLNETLWSI